MTFEQHVAETLRDQLRSQGVRIAKTIVPPTWTGYTEELREEALSRLQWENDERSRAMFLKAVK